jgi:hypothetical protein
MQRLANQLLCAATKDGRHWVTNQPDRMPTTGTNNIAITHAMS